MSARSHIEEIVEYVRDTIAAIDGTGDYAEDLSATGAVTIGQPTQAPTRRAVAIHTIGIPSVEPATTRQIRVYVTMQIACYSGLTGVSPEARIYDAWAMASDVHLALMMALQLPASPALYSRLEGAVGDEGTDTGRVVMQLTAYYHTDGAL